MTSLGGILEQNYDIIGGNFGTKSTLAHIELTQRHILVAVEVTDREISHSHTHKQLYAWTDCKLVNTNKTKRNNWLIVCIHNATHTLSAYTAACKDTCILNISRFRMTHSISNTMNNTH